MEKRFKFESFEKLHRISFVSRCACSCYCFSISALRLFQNNLVNRRKTGCHIFTDLKPNYQQDMKLFGVKPPLPRTRNRFILIFRHYGRNSA